MMPTHMCSVFKTSWIICKHFYVEKFHIKIQTSGLFLHVKILLELNSSYSFNPSPGNQALIGPLYTHLKSLAYHCICACMPWFTVPFFHVAHSDLNILFHYTEILKFYLLHSKAWRENPFSTKHQQKWNIHIKDLT